MKPTIEYLESLARQAGAILLAGLDEGFRIDLKGEIDLVTEMDRRSEEFLLSQIRSRFPDHRLLAEESGGSGGGGSTGSWLIDPLDGTVNYAHGVPFYGVSIAFASGGQTQLGVVYQPALDECYSAERGRGAWLNGGPIHPSHSAHLNDSLLTTGFAYDIRTRLDNNLAEYSRLALRTRGVRRLGSAALDCCYVAAGRLDGYWELAVRPWDVAAGALIAECAGASVSNCAGGADYLSEPCSILVTAPGIYAELLAALR